ncbi:hypothetical protein V8C35DRAFT_290840 [Trichoderma chlorosporum]
MLGARLPNGRLVPFIVSLPLSILWLFWDSVDRTQMASGHRWTRAGHGARNSNYSTVTRASWRKDEGLQTPSSTVAASRSRRRGTPLIARRAQSGTKLAENTYSQR